MSRSQTNQFVQREYPYPAARCVPEIFVPKVGHTRTGCLGYSVDYLRP